MSNVIKQKRISPEDNLVILTLEKMTSDNRHAINSLLDSYSIDWERFKELIIYHEFTPLAYMALKDYGSFLPHEFREFLKNNYYCTLIRCQQLWQEFLRISLAFEQAQVNILPIKGVALLEDVYTQQPARVMTDIDLLVKEEDLQKAEDIFCNLGYRKGLLGLKEEYWREHQCHLTFFKRENAKVPFVEVHWGIDFKRKNRTILPELWRRVRDIKVDGRMIKLLSPEDTLFSLALHNRRFGKTLCLKNAYDAILLLNKYGDNFNWDYCLAMSKKYGLYASLCFILLQAKTLSEISLPPGLWEKLKLPAWKKRMIENFIEKNSFSEKRMQNKSLYLKSHFLLYDTFWEPISYILNIPREQFAKYYCLNTYAKKTDFLYNNRLFYIPFKTLFNYLGKRCANKPKHIKCKTTTSLSFVETTGFSMWPFLRAEDKVIVKRIPLQDLKIGDIILYLKDNQQVCHRLVKKIRRKEEYLLFASGDNSSSTEPVSEDMFSGKAIATIRKNRLKNLTTVHQQFISHIVVILSPFIRGSLKIAKFLVKGG